LLNLPQIILDEQVCHANKSTWLFFYLLIFALKINLGSILNLKKYGMSFAEYNYTRKGMICHA